ncbi:CHASE3 domain-containing protein [Granulicella mallensis]|uniref:histidine kinase n=1 Tax=Granulicella mallensis TaxID=940614 RepID=A0A7W7ZQF2_9BACT|nr:CHASE3 domain-containing protein [Granulicella mallensis]MBB5064230.1 PAS domain S-box-containing protein [Granulicella mallensis]
MQVISKRFGVIGGFALMLLLLAINTVTTRHQLAIQLDSQAWVAHSRMVLLELAKTESLLKDAETGQRGFLYTGDPKYLAPYQSAIHEINSHIDRLSQLTADNPQQQARVTTLRQLSNAKLNELAQTIALYRADKTDAAKALVLSDAGLRSMDQIRSLIGEMGREEDSLHTTRAASYRKSVQGTIFSIYLASAVAGLGLIFLAYYILREMDLRQKHARQLLDREEWFRVTLTSLGDAVIATDELGSVTYLNPLAEQLMGTTMPEVVGRTIEDVFPIFNEMTHAPVENPVTRVMELGRIVGLANHTVLQHTDGSLIPIEDSASPIRDRHDQLIGVVLVFRDATQERKTQELLRETEKLTATARLSATVAHEINNPLEAIGNLIYLAKGTPGIPVDAAEHLETAEQELERVSHITKQTLGFYRESKVPERIDLPSLIEYVLKLCANKLRAKNITVLREYEECPHVPGISGELKQAISNLISNAADAVNEDGTIWIRLACVEDTGSSFVRVEIEDDGPGISPEHIDRIFEPFYTTKKDVGTGLGLWVTKEIVDRHGGMIHIHPQSKDGARGAAFKVSLPCPPSEPATQKPGMEASHP